MADLLHPLQAVQLHRRRECYRLTCTCGAEWERRRLADAAIAHERHQTHPEVPADEWDLLD